EHVVDKPKLPQLAVARQMKTDQLVIERQRSKLEEPDLTLDRDAGVAIVNLGDRQARFGEQRLWRNSSRAQPGAEQAGDAARCAGQLVEAGLARSCHSLSGKMGRSGKLPVGDPFAAPRCDLAPDVN